MPALAAQTYVSTVCATQSSDPESHGGGTVNFDIQVARIQTYDKVFGLQLFHLVLFVTGCFAAFHLQWSLRTRKIGGAE